MVVGGMAKACQGGGLAREATFIAKPDGNAAISLFDPD